MTRHRETPHGDSTERQPRGEEGTTVRLLAFAEERGFLISLSDEAACWTWQGHLDRDGYAKVRWQGAPGKLAHRVIYAEERGPIPAGLQLDHLCRNRACVNPLHLEPVTPLENTRRGNAPSQSRRRSGRCGNGHEYNAKNTRIDGSRWRCRPCEAERAARYAARKREAAA